MRADCGMTHYLDPVVRETLIQISPSKKAEIEAMEFGEIKGSYVLQSETDLEVHADVMHTGLKTASERISLL